MTDQLFAIRCRGCSRRIGVASGDTRAFCDPWCAADYPAVPAEARDALMQCLHETAGVANAELARQFSMSRQRVTQIMGDRDPRL